MRPIHTSGLKRAKSAVIQMRGSGYDAARNRPTPVRNVNISGKAMLPQMGSKSNKGSRTFKGFVPGKYRDRISKDQMLKELL